MRTDPRRWTEIMMNDEFYSSLFSEYSALLSRINVIPSEAVERMLQLHEDDVTTYTDQYIFRIFHLNYITNYKKYNELAGLYESNIDIFSPVNITESYLDVRRPNLTSTSSSSIEKKQSVTMTSTPATTDTTTHSVNPYDNTGLRQETQDTSSTSGSDTTVTSYSGQPDTTSGTVTSTGSETYEHQLTKSGRDGKFTISDIIEQAELTADKLDILDIIIQDIANQIFLQIWI